jgi:hypothetical protein
LLVLGMAESTGSNKGPKLAERVDGVPASWPGHRVQQVIESNVSPGVELPDTPSSQDPAHVRLLRPLLDVASTLVSDHVGPSANLARGTDNPRLWSASSRHSKAHFVVRQSLRFVLGSPLVATVTRLIGRGPLRYENQEHRTVLPEVWHFHTTNSYAQEQPLR